MAVNWTTKCFFLTYSQCNITKEVLKEHLLVKLRRWVPIYIVVGHELHEDGGHHLHAMAVLTRQSKIKAANFFDLEDFHPNVVSNVVSRQQCYTYCRKENDHTEFGEWSPVEPKESKWAPAVAAETQEDFWAIVKESNPRDYILQREKLEYYANWKYAKEVRRLIGTPS